VRKGVITLCAVGLITALGVVLAQHTVLAKKVYRVRLSSSYYNNNLYEVDSTGLYLDLASCTTTSGFAVIEWEYRGSYNNKVRWFDYDGKLKHSLYDCRIEKVFAETDLD
jgi:hypothetical protein